MNIEFYMDYSGTFQKLIYFKLDGNDWRKFDDLSEIEIEAIFSHLLKFKTARTGLLHLSRFIAKGKRETLRQYIYCNWTRIDNRMDVSDRKLQFEKVFCPFKHTGNCPFQGKGIVCVKY